MTEYRIEQAASGLYVLAIWDDGWNSFNNCYVLTLGGEAILIDSGKAEHAPALVRALRKPGLAEMNVTAIVATHGHHDHVGGAVAAAQFASVPKHIHAADKGLLPPEARNAWHADVPDSGELLGLDCVLLGQHTLGSVALFHSPTRALFWGDHLCFFGASVDDEGLVCFGAARRERVLRGISWRDEHWPPDPSEQEKLQIDLAGRPPEDQQRHNFPLAIDGIKRVSASFKPELLCTGHGPVPRGDVTRLLEQAILAAG